MFDPYNDDDNDYIIIDELRNNKTPFFRKMSPPRNHINNEHIELSNNEKRFIRILMNYPHPNIVKYYKINDEYIDMELLDIKKDLKKHKKEIIKIMKNVKEYLQDLGVLYIDWKYDNIGYSKIDKTYKLFDFDVSGLIDIKTNKWLIKPPNYWNYDNAIKNNITDPYEIDDYCFNYLVVD
jgi:serine/threonine protein kinase